MLCCIVKVMSTLFYGFPYFSSNMNTRRTPATRVKENDVHQEIPPQVEQVLQGAQGDQVPIVGGDNDVRVVPPRID